MPIDPYDDPDLQPSAEDYPDQVRFERERDRVRGRVLSVEKITTRYGAALKLMLYTDQGERSMLAGPSPKNLVAQLVEKRPRPGDVVTIELIELRALEKGTAKLFDVQVEKGNSQSLAPGPVAREARQEPPSQLRAPDPGRAPAPRPIQTDDEPDLFDE